MNKTNYQLELDKIIDEITKKDIAPKLLLHSCCAPCSSYCLSYLATYFEITVFYYNPNISPADEYRKRVEEQKRLINELPVVHKVSFVEGKYNPDCFTDMAKGMEKLPEGGERCFACYELRQREAAIFAKNNGYDFFTTTLSISPHKNAQKLNEIGLKLQEEYGVRYLVSDFKKKGGYQESIRLSKEYNLYRQNYCGCIYSRQASRDKYMEDSND